METMFILSIKDSKLEKISFGTLDSPKIVVLSHEVLFVKFHKHAQTKQGTPVKMLRVKRATHNM